MTESAFDRGQKHVAEAEQLLEELVRDRGALLKQKAELDLRIEEYDKLIAKIRAQATTGATTVAESEPSVDELAARRQRTSGVKRSVEATVRILHANHTWMSQDLIIEEATRRDTRLNGKAVASSLSRLYDEGVLLREGKRGKFRFALAKIDQTPPADDVQSSGGTQDNGPLLSPTELILGKLRTSDPAKGVSKKELGWVVGDVTTLDHSIATLIASGDIYMNEDGHYALADRVQHQRKLFPNADDPDQPEEVPSAQV